MSAKSQRQEILQVLDYCKSLPDDEDNETVYSTLMTNLSQIMKSNFLPLLDLFLAEHISVCTRMGKMSEVVSDYFIRLAPQVRTSNPSNVIESMKQFLDSCGEVQSIIPDEFKNLFPIGFQVKYDKERIIAGEKVNILSTIISHASVPLAIDNLSYTIVPDENEDNQTLISIADNIELQPKKPLKLSVERLAPLGISKETIKGLVIKVKGASVKVPFNGTPLLISPDISACNINIEMPPRCIIGSKQPFKVILTAADQKIERLNVHFAPDPLSDPVEITGKCGDIEIANNHTDLPDIEPSQSLTLDMFIFSQHASQIPVSFTVRFGTASSGTGEFQRVIPFSFQSPFKSDIKLFNDNFIEIHPSKIPILEPDSEITAEVTLSNQIDSSITISSINSEETESISIDSSDLPITLSPYETFSFLVTIKKGGEYQIHISFNTEGIESNTLTVKLPEIQNSDKNTRFEFITPPTAELYKEFETKIIIQCNDNIKGPDVVPVQIDLGASPGFFINGPLKNHIVHVFRGQKKEVVIKFIPLEAGSTTLPQVLITDSSSESKEPKSFVMPIVITYQ